MAEKIGIYVCHCGSNIAGTIDVEEVARWAGKNIKDVVVSKDYKFMCSSLGQQMIEDDIKEKGLTGVVVGACSPHLHEKTFRATCKRAGLNPFLCQMTNLREHVSWVNADKEAGTIKAKSLISAAAERVKHQQPLEPMRVKVNPATLVVGGGIAGLQATLELADAGYHVYLVEREPSIGGHMAQFDKTFPTLDCSACILTPKMSEVGQHENVTMFTYSELEEVTGSVGNFKVKIRKKARYVDYDKCTGCGICIEKCPKKVVDDVFEAGMGNRKAIYTPFPQAVPRMPVIDTANCTWFTKGKCQVCSKVCPTAAVDYDQKDEIVELEVGNIIMATGWKLFDCKRIPQYGYGRLANVYTNMEFERLCNAAGPTNGKIVMRDGKTEPKSVAIIHCVGSRDAKTNPYCSSVCCMAALKLEHLLLEKTKAEVYAFYIDMRTPMKDYEEFYQRLLEEGVHFVRGKVAEVTEAARDPEEKGKLVVQVEDTLVGQAAADSGRHGRPDGRDGAAGRRQGIGHEVRHLVQHGRLVHRAAPEARPRGHHDRRRVRGRRVPGAEGHSGLGGPGRRGRRPHRRHDHQGRSDDRADRGLDRRGGLLRLPHLQQHVPVQRHRVRRGEGRQPRDHRVVQGLRHVRGRLPGRRHHRRPLQQRADLRRDRRDSVGREGSSG